VRRGYRIERGAVTAVARSPIHDSEATWRRVSGTIELDVDAPADAPRVELAVEMAAFEVGLGKRGALADLLDARRYPRASFRLTALELGGRERARGVIGWRGVDVEIDADLVRAASADRLRAELRFELELPRFGVRPPRVLGVALAPRVSIHATLTAVAA
jgi:polyisoprenoid-binding protein YceI